ncbi:MULTISPECIES: tRNA (adenosine(37)-N6)-dimethylallyltransferase MiaA [unclassified Dehalobacter]|uniref:tRNA (adenosine(37)-N6)-dimethylallyltransferase MiaA n=1 Tax=unclassified Dehalobacter TaxID=2635733 RepID=UPI000E6B94E8|nr:MULTISPECIES: tRNA (adenosine(37)-N6)-dimethylallyltransferase MiaA [unclassified Dehalobacter]RJE48011.1 tRNA (adenosine(37)-N6)-dimethylallyltransferase MiaA [Dehalobacter sp. MCB1]TCX50581.1 tRNA (adenosine(37)-N6)-dimethylallyltransferase MiaA [Dehalobacter sp. 14DCB1]TCX52175.1 tRNA (adenosine(37)-N6)-dimethylallyltransferase MiaA [Dehalobacter sp. 12DCB1]
MKPLIVIIGPTAVGKSALGVELALRLNGEIISGDSVQVYRKLDIGSAKPSKVEQKGVPHHLIDLLDPAEPFTVAGFQSQARKWIENIQAKGKIPIVVGGTGLYIRSILDEFEFPEEGSDPIKQKWLAYTNQHGNKELHQRLAKCDRASAEKLHVNDTARIVRALEIFELTGKPLSEQRSYMEKMYAELDESVIYLGLTAPRDVIYERINERCQKMVDCGIIGETLRLLQEGYSPRLKSLQTIGYRHVVYFLRGLVTQKEMLRLLQRDTRHFAKRQLTWFRRDPRIKWYDVTECSAQQILDEICDSLDLHSDGN